MSLLKTWLTPNFGNPKERFIYVDGAPYDGGPDAVRRVVRAFKTPSVQIAVTATAIIGAAAAVVTKRPDIAVGATFCMTAGCISNNRDCAKRRARDFPELRHVVIDKAGRTFTDPNALLHVERYYGDTIETASLTVAAIPIFTALCVGFGAPLLVCSSISALLATPFLSRLAFAIYARSQLDRQNWTATATPPPSRKAATAPAGPLLKVNAT
jgi:hypothetical protein